LREGEETLETLKTAIRDVPDFPKPGIVFKDITTLLGRADLLAEALRGLAALAADLAPTRVVAVESRGFILGGALADRLGLGFVPVRKPGKLPWKAVRCTYALEYGTDSLEMHEDALAAGERVVVVDDVLATGGTAAATGELVERLGATVAGYVFLVELAFLAGRARLAGREVRSLITY
jgi:adenine phosphoribosyltransferase